MAAAILRHCERLTRPISTQAQASSDQLALMIKECGISRDLTEARKTEALVSASPFNGDRYLLNFLIEMYGHCGSTEDVRLVFEKIAIKNRFSWFIMVRANAENGKMQEAIHLFRRMQVEGAKPDKYMLTTVLGVCTSLSALKEGKVIHDIAMLAELDTEIVIATSLLHMYSRCGCVREARLVFEKLEQKDAVTWTAMISAYARRGYPREALNLFHLMDVEGVKPDNVTFVSIVNACTILGAYKEGKLVHERTIACGCDTFVVLGTALLYMHGKCGSIEDAKGVFDKMTVKNVVTWNAMMAAYAQHGHWIQALQLLKDMDHEGVVLDSDSFSSLVDACAGLTYFSQGKAIHNRIICSGWDKVDVVVQSSLLNMYGKCGKLVDARKVFDGMDTRNVISWNAMIGAYAQNGYAEDVVELFFEMNLDGSRPDDITFMSVMCACGHGGLIQDARHYFISMAVDYRIVASIEHYGCLIDVLGRGSWLKEAEELIQEMPFQPDIPTWTSFLRACQNQDELDRGMRIAMHAFQSFPGQHGLYVLLSGMFASSQSRTIDSPD